MEVIETKEFLKTSEFYVVVLTNVGLVLTQMIDLIPPKYGIPLQSLANMCYVLSRGIAKAGVTPVVVPTAPPIIVEGGSTVVATVEDLRAQLQSKV